MSEGLRPRWHDYCVDVDMDWGRMTGCLSVRLVGLLACWLAGCSSWCTWCAVSVGVIEGCEGSAGLYSREMCCTKNALYMLLERADKHQ
jgi:hypothetical protein